MDVKEIARVYKSLMENNTSQIKQQVVKEPQIVDQGLLYHLINFSTNISIVDKKHIKVENLADQIMASLEQADSYGNLDHYYQA